MSAIPLLTSSAIIWTGARATYRAEELVNAFLSGRNERTLEAYQQDLEDFRAFVNAPSVQEAGRVLIGLPHGEANGLVLAYRGHLLERGLQASTINRKLAAIRSLVKLGRTLGLVDWSLDIGGLKTTAYRDTRGPGSTGVHMIVHAIENRVDAKGTRDKAILRLLYDLGLRRGEVVSMDLSDVDMNTGAASITGKGRTQKQALTLPDSTRKALAAWIEARGAEPGPLFTNLDRAGKGERLTGRSVHRIVQGLGREVGIETRPHGIRHAAITEALDLTKGDVRAVQRFSRHRDLRTLTIYDDNRTDMAGEVAKLVSEKV
jgi:integrase/recombinase XerC